MIFNVIIKKNKNPSNFFLLKKSYDDGMLILHHVEKILEIKEHSV